MISYYQGNELRRIPQLLAGLKTGKNTALTSNAGTPLISDPGFKLVRAAVKAGIKVLSIPGPSAVLTALVASGLPTDKFLFLGFLPKKAGKRKRLLQNCQKLPFSATVVFYESPYRLLKTLTAIEIVFGDIKIVIAREMTKLHEEFHREKISSAISHFSKTKPKGEFTLLFNISQG